MGGFLSYSIISGLLMLAMYLAYRLFLARDNQHGFNRGVLLGIYFVSFLALPVMSISENPASQSTAMTLSVNESGWTDVIPATHSEPVWGTILIWIFLAGMIVVTVRTVIVWAKLLAVIRFGEKIVRNGYTLVVTEDERYAPFSWMNYMVISRKDYENNCSAIAAHELKHIVARHWIDLLIAQAVCIIGWFNPAAWLMRDELMLIHEYQADIAVIEKGHDPQEYQMLLIKKAVGARFPSLANSLNHSKLKKRITMMYKEKSGAGRKLKALALVPMLALVLGVVSVPTVRAVVSTISGSELSPGKDTKNLPKKEIRVQRFKVTNINNDGNRMTVVIKGENLGDNLTVSGGTLTSGGKTCNANSLQCEMTDGMATITAVFPFAGDSKNSKLTLMINGNEIPFNLENFSRNSRTVMVGDDGNTSKPTVSAIVINGDTSSVPADMTIYLDGEEISEADLRALSSGNIASVAVDSQNNAIKITSKK